MFQGCSSLTKLYINNFKIKKKANINNMLSGCSSLKDLKCFDKNIKSQYNRRDSYY